MPHSEAGQDAVVMRSPLGEIVYTDSRDHFENGLLRLLQMEPDEFDLWLSYAEEEPTSELLPRLGAALDRLRPLPADTGAAEHASVDPGPGSVAGRLWHRVIAESPDYGMARAHDKRLAWLVRGRRAVRARDPSLRSTKRSISKGIAQRPAGTAITHLSPAGAWRRPIGR